MQVAGTALHQVQKAAVTCVILTAGHGLELSRLATSSTNDTHMHLNSPWAGSQQQQPQQTISVALLLCVQMVQCSNNSNLQYNQKNPDTLVYTTNIQDCMPCVQKPFITNSFILVHPAACNSNTARQLPPCPQQQGLLLRASFRPLLLLQLQLQRTVSCQLLWPMLHSAAQLWRHE